MNVRPLSVDVIDHFERGALEELCRATRAIVDEGSESSFGGAPTEERLASFWRGVALAPHRILIVGRYDGVISGAFQLIRHSAMSESGPYVAELANFFVAPWARGQGLAQALMQKGEDEAKARGIRVIDLSVRASRHRAIELFESFDYERWGEKPHYALINGHLEPGYFYSKRVNGD